MGTKRTEGGGEIATKRADVLFGFFSACFVPGREE